MLMADDDVAYDELWFHSIDHLESFHLHFLPEKWNHLTWKIFESNKRTSLLLLLLWSPREYRRGLRLVVSIDVFNPNVEVYRGRSLIRYASPNDQSHACFLEERKLFISMTFDTQLSLLFQIVLLRANDWSRSTNSQPSNNFSCCKFVMFHQICAN